MNLYLIRHGYTEENEKGTYYGAVDPGLNEKGFIQCEKIKIFMENIAFQKVFCSPLKRAKETAYIVTESHARKDERIRERDFGIFEGKTYEELKDDRYLNIEYEKWCNNWLEYKIPEGESYMEFCQRVYDFMDEVLLKYGDDENILIVTHAGVIKVIYTYIMNKKPELFWKFSSENGDVSMIKYEYGNLFIDYINHFKEE
ncbi:alpha-ribazole phosphatase [Hathewaya proteolytica DSM 3090]|uniref:Alpha-ribazole phosphatase n=1 Tax=Hathewaya proteolytica DSM 3090 TaxID=1121331 RepID=A0A1M6Q5K5_9CLOT|nr:alpha-ribazole phosphatase [Hathewaya proteolytica]SHK15471.1 alpha-ribazole phosphatase [Hathewaya proteolytica DSM 3090]